MSDAAVFSVAPDYYRFAVAELREWLPVNKIRRLGPDAGLVYLADDDASLAAAQWIARSAERTDLRFIRAVAGVDAEWSRQATIADQREIAQWAVDVALDALNAGDTISLHVWDSGEQALAPGKVRRAALELLLDNGIRVIPGGAATILSICLGENGITTGLTPSEWALSDWAGGRIRLAHRKEQVSRAEFKLEELFTLVGEPQANAAIDLGASPGGWTRILRSIGVGLVHAVDPADLAPSLLADRGVIHHRTTAGEFIDAFEDEVGGQVDLIVNDMRMVPHLTAHTMVDAARLLPPGGLAIVTFKLGTNNPIKQTDESLDILADAYDPEFVRQLQHNRHELTIVARRR